MWSNRPGPTMLLKIYLNTFVSELLYTSELPGAPTTLQLFNNNGGDEGDQVGGPAGLHFCG